jgi:hypothetical protein
MDLNTIQMPRAAARKAYLDLRAGIREQRDLELDAVRRRHLRADEAAARAYRHLSVGNQLLRLSPTILGGFDDTGRPKIAITRADVPEVLMIRWGGGELVFCPSDDEWTRDRTKRFTFEAERREPGRLNAVATTPTIPQEFRPATRLSNYHILWEAAWRAQRTAPRAPRDPALLKHLGGDLWAVLAVWDLTPVEAAVLEASRV